MKELMLEKFTEIYTIHTYIHILCPIKTIKFYVYKCITPIHIPYMPANLRVFLYHDRIV